MNLEIIKKKIRDVHDFPKKGIIFKDLTPVLEDKSSFNLLIDEIIKKLDQNLNISNIDKIVGIESRGFVFASALAYRLHKGLVLVRKPNKLPSKKYSQTYQLEYGSDELEMHIDSILPNENILIIDDVLATGGTAKAAGELVLKAQGIILAYSFVIEIEKLNGKEKLKPFQSLSLIHF